MNFIKNRSKLVMVGLAIVTGVVLLGSQRVSAQCPEPSSFTKQFNTMVDSIAKKIGLTSDQVEAVFDEARNERQAQWQTQFEERLTQAVTEGVLTEAQKQDIVTKYKELQSKWNSQFEIFQKMTPEERRTAKENERQELEAWAKAKGISLTVLRGLGVDIGGHRGFKMSFGMGHHF